MSKTLYIAEFNRDDAENEASWFIADSNLTPEQQEDEAYRVLAEEFDEDIDNIRDVVEVENVYAVDNKMIKEVYESQDDQIAIVWSIDDVKGLDSDREDENEAPLTDDEAKRVLSLLKSEHDASIGINWDTIQEWIDYVKGERE